jgi:RNA polymerase sigma-70 factor (ECF subfamily)
LYRALQCIPDAQREVVVLYELEGLEGAQVSEMLGIPEGTVWTRLHHGRKKLLAALQRDHREGRP